MSSARGRARLAARVMGSSGCGWRPVTTRAATFRGSVDTVYLRGHPSALGRGQRPIRVRQRDPAKSMNIVRMAVDFLERGPDHRLIEPVDLLGGGLDYHVADVVIVMKRKGGTAVERHVDLVGGPEADAAQRVP